MGSLSYSVLLTWLLISIAAFVLALKKGTRSERFFSGLVILVLGLIFIGILMNNPIGVTLFTACIYLVILFSYRKKQTDPVSEQI